MFIALDENNDKVNAKCAERIRDYYCPLCGESVILKRGEIKVPHFAHKSVRDCESFHKDMSEWHRNWQELFPIEHREVIVKNKLGEKHIADIGVYKTVVEFQHSSISKEEFEKRNTFYTSMGYRVIWVFDCINDESLKFIDGVADKYNIDADEFYWGRPFKCLKGFQPRDNSVIEIYINIVPLGENPKNEYADCCLEKVIWTPRYNKRNHWNKLWVKNNSPKNYYELWNELCKRCEVDLMCKRINSM